MFKLDSEQNGAKLTVNLFGRLLFDKQIKSNNQICISDSVYNIAFIHYTYRFYFCYTE